MLLSKPALIFYFGILSFTCLIFAERPNILFLSIDDLRPELGCYGVNEIHSPNIDQLAKEGVRFDRAYCQIAVCNPSRVSIMTGLRPDSAKMWTLDVRFRHTVPNAVTLPQHFKANGYETRSYGKIFHNPWPDNVSWSKPHGWPKGAGLWSEDAKKRFREFKEKLRKEGKPERLINRLRPQAVEVVELEDGEHIDGAIALQAIESMRELAKKEEPFFLAAGFIRPHLPFVVSKKYWDLYDREKITLANDPHFPKGAPAFAMNTMYELRDYFDYLGTPRPDKGELTEDQQRELKHGYYASVSMIDAQVGKILSELEKLGLEDNTIVVLWSDHGFKLGEHNSWCKQTNYEIDTRVPFIIRAPGAKANGKSTKALVELIDVFPTLCELAGVEAPKELEGSSLKPLLEGSAEKVKDAAISQFTRRLGKQHLMGYALRTDQYRYVEWIDRQTKETIATELYDHAADPSEKQNGAAKEEKACTVKELAKQLRETLPLPLAPVDPRLLKGRPNIVVIMGDDWSAPHASILGDKVVKTPTFDRIAREGILFENAFVSTPSCTPSRFSIVSGQHPWLLGEAGNLGGSIGKDVPVYTDILKTGGYHVGFSRKGAAPSQHKYRKNDPFGAKHKDFSTFLEQRRQQQPFCYWYGAGEPHRPYDWEASKGKLPLDKIEVPPYLPDNATTRTDLGDYYLRVQKLDKLAEQILKKLTQMGELENTLIVMSGDNGMPFPRAKATLYDAGTKVPLAIRWGKVIQPNQKTQNLVSLHQLAPLFLKAAGQTIPASMSDHTLLPIAESKLPESNKHVITGMERHVYPNPSRAIRTLDFLLIRNFSPKSWPNGKKENLPTWDFSKTPWPTVPGAFSHNVDPSPTKQWMRQNTTNLNELAFGVRPELELYQLKNDHHQMKNLAKNPKYQKILKNLQETLANEFKALKNPRADQL